MQAVIRREARARVCQPWPFTHKVRVQPVGPVATALGGRPWAGHSAGTVPPPQTALNFFGYQAK